VQPSLLAQDDVLDVLVHVDPEVGDAADMAAGQLPSREILVPQLERLFADLPRPERMILHYLEGRSRSISISPPAAWKTRTFPDKSKRVSANAPAPSR